MKSKFQHLTSNPISGKSLATFIGRNDAAINLVLDLFKDKKSLKIAILGCGVFEPLTVGASRRLPKDTLIAAYDNSALVTNSICALLNVTNKITNPIGSNSLPESRLFYHKQVTKERIDYLNSIGIDTSLLLDANGYFNVSDSICSIVQVYYQNIMELPKQWEENNQLWDIIICVNVLPNLSVALGRDIVKELLSQLWDYLQPGGIALFGTIDSHFYTSSLYPNGLNYFSGEMFTAIQHSPWTLLGWVDRAFVKEYYEQLVLIDGYMYFFLGKYSCDFQKHLSIVKYLLPKQMPNLLLEEVWLTEDVILEYSRNQHILATFRSGSIFHTIQTPRCFPQSLISLFSNVEDNELSLGICEKLLLPI